MYTVEAYGHMRKCNVHHVSKALVGFEKLGWMLSCKLEGPGRQGNDLMKFAFE